MKRFEMKDYKWPSVDKKFLFLYVIRKGYKIHEEVFRRVNRGAKPMFFFCFLFYQVLEFGNIQVMRLYLGLRRF